MPFYAFLLPPLAYLVLLIVKPNFSQNLKIYLRLAFCWSRDSFNAAHACAGWLLKATRQLLILHSIPLEQIIFPPPIYQRIQIPNPSPI